MSTTLNKLEYTDETKEQIKTALNTNFNAGITDNDTFRSYVTKINTIYNNWQKVTDEGTDLTLNGTKKGKMVLGLKGNTSQESTTGKNFLPKILDGEHSDYGITVTVKDNVVKIKGTTDGVNNYSHNFELETPFVYPAGTLYLHERNTTAYNSTSIGVRFTDYTNVFATLGATNRIIGLTSSEEKTAYYFNVYIGASQGAIDVELTPSFELTDSVTDFEPYTGGQASPNPDFPQDIHVVTVENSITIENEDGTSEQNYPVNLGSIELCKISDYQDYLYRENGNWYKHGAIGKVVFDGSENWIYSNNIGNFYRYYLAKFAEIAWLRPILSNNFIDRGSQDYGEYNFIQLPGLELYIQIENITTLADFKTWLSTHNTTVYYPLDTPTTTQITDTTLISQLEAIYKAQSYDNQTNISQTNDDLPFIINASALLKGGN